MPRYAEHRRINYSALLIFAPLVFYFGQDYKFVIVFIVSYIIGTDYITPDLDIHSTPGKRLGMFSYPIRKSSTHRGWGHCIFIGWFLKVICISMIMSAILYIFGCNLRCISNIDLNIVYAFILGMFLSNDLHNITDWLRDNNRI